MQLTRFTELVLVLPDCWYLDLTAFIAEKVLSPDERVSRNYPEEGYEPTQNGGNGEQVSLQLLIQDGYDSKINFGLAVWLTMSANRNFVFNLSHYSLPKLC